MHEKKNKSQVHAHERIEKARVVQAGACENLYLIRVSFVYKGSRVSRFAEMCKQQRRISRYRPTASGGGIHPPISTLIAAYINKAVRTHRERGKNSTAPPSCRHQATEERKKGERAHNNAARLPLRQGGRKRTRGN
jgi:hypothetical protein